MPLSPHRTTHMTHNHPRRLVPSAVSVPSGKFHKHVRTLLYIYMRTYAHIDTSTFTHLYRNTHALAAHFDCQEAPIFSAPLQVHSWFVPHQVGLCRLERSGRRGVRERYNPSGPISPIRTEDILRDHSDTDGQPDCKFLILIDGLARRHRLW